MNGSKIITQKFGLITNLNIKTAYAEFEQEMNKFTMKFPNTDTRQMTLSQFNTSIYAHAVAISYVFTYSEIFTLPELRAVPKPSVRLKVYSEHEGVCECGNHNSIVIRRNKDDDSIMEIKSINSYCSKCGAHLQGTLKGEDISFHQKCQMKLDNRK